MASATDLASTIGTWVAAFLALVALVGVVGPLLVWRASQTSRNKALAKLNAGNAEDGGYITKGLPIGWQVRLFRRFHAPWLIRQPSVAGRCMKWDNNTRLPDRDSASWVKFGAVLDAYNISYQTSDCIVIENETAVLPATRIWVLVVGILGRFGNRRNNGRLPRRENKKLKSIQAKPGEHIPWGMSTPSQQPRSLPWMTPDKEDWARSARYPGDYSDHGRQGGRLSGVIEIMEFGSYGRPSESLTLTMHDQSEIGDLSTESLGIDRLFWLAAGCIPMMDGRVFCLEDPQVFIIDDFNDHSDESDSNIQPPLGPVTPAAHVHFADVYDGDDQYTSAHVVSNTTPSTYVWASSQTPGGFVRNRYSGAPRKFQFAIMEDRVRSLIDVATVVGAESQDIRTFSLAEVEVTDDELAMLEQDAKLFSSHLSTAGYVWGRRKSPASNTPQAAGFSSGTVHR